MSLKTAILIFANSAKEEVIRKPISGGYRLFTELNNTIESVVKSTTIPYYIFTEEQQQGTNFGERFTNALQTIYEKGYDTVIAVGNDTPFLTKNHLLESVSLLEKNKIVIGPSADGGFYLMGLHKSQFDVANFLKLPWQSNQLTKSLTCLLENLHHKIIKLQVFYDIDTLEDLRRIQPFRKTISKKLLQIINAVLTTSNKYISFQTITYHSGHSSIFYNKGSPLRYY